MADLSIVSVQTNDAVAVKRWIVALVLLGALISAFFDRISIAVLFTNTDFQAAMDTGFDPAKLGLLMTAFLIPYGISALLLSFAGDVFGPRRALCASAALWGGLMILMGAAGSYAAMFIYRTLLGIAEGPQLKARRQSAKLSELQRGSSFRKADWPPMRRASPRLGQCTLRAY
jgi:MFS family permease